MIGRLRHRVVLQRHSEAADMGGGVALSWVDVAELWAAVTPLAGSESVQAMRLQPLQNFMIRLRFRGDITPENRLLFGQRVLNIRSVKNVNERSQWLECRCEEGVAG